MPELAEVYFYASRWRKAAGETVRVAWLHERARCCRTLDPDRFRRAIDGATLEDGYTHGKRMLFQFSGGWYLETHLGMTGKLLRVGGEREEEKHDHLALRCGDATLVFQDSRMFGKLALHESRDGLPAWWEALPPQPHDEGFSKRRFEGFCERRGKSPLKAFLLLQDLFPGVGNWMADEILWRAKLRPDRPVSSLDAKERSALYRELRWVCRRAIEIIGQDFSDPPSSWLFSHRWKDGGRCPKTKEPLKRESIGGRTTCWSPARQG